MNFFSESIPKLIRRSFNTEILIKSRLPWVDYLRGIAILLVVYRHALLGIERSGLYVPVFLSQANMVFYSFRMPLFFIVSGIFIGGSLKKKTWQQVAVVKFENLFYPYLIWATIQITLQIILKGYVNSERTWVDYTYLLYNPRNIDQFWYLPALFNVSLIYLLLRHFFKTSVLAQLLLGLTLYFLSPLFSQVSMMSDWMEFYFFFALGDAVSKLFFMERSQRILKSSYTLLACIPVFALTQYFYLSRPEDYYRHSIVGESYFILIAMIGCVSMFALAFRLQSLKTLSFLRIIGFHSLYIYAMHVLVIAFIRVCLTKFAGIHQTGVLLTLGIAFGVTVPVVVYNLFIRENFAWFLFSFRKKEKRSL